MPECSTTLPSGLSINRILRMARRARLPLPLLTEYFVEDGKVRIGGAHAKTVFVFKDRTIYVIDNASRTVHILKRATLSEVAAHYADEVKQLEEAAANVPAEERAEAQRKATVMREVNERMRQTMPRNYRVTVRRSQLTDTLVEYGRNGRRMSNDWNSVWRPWLHCPVAQKSIVG